MEEKFKSFVVKGEDTLLNVLDKNLNDISNKKIKSFIKYKMVEVDGKVVTNSSKIILKGSNIKVYFTRRFISECNLNIIYEDDDLIVIDKPHGLLSVSNSKEKERTAFRMVSDYVKIKSKNVKIFVVHRLDRETSGVLMFSKNYALKERLQQEWNDLVLKREYVAVVEGEIKESGTIRSYLINDKFQMVRSTKNGESGKMAITSYQPLKYKDEKTLLKIDIATGRKNQIRAHMSELGCPIVGDKKYGAKTNQIKRMALHASKLYVKDPRGEKIMKFESEIPREIKNLVR